MTHHHRRLRILATSLCLPLALGAVAAAATASAPTPARHRFALRIDRFALRVVFMGDRCHGRTGCVALTGTLKGTMTAVAQHIPDAGRQFRVSAHGRLSPLGRVTVTGTIRGPGYIRFGQESLQLVVRSAHGTIGVDGRSAGVPGFTSP